MPLTIVHLDGPLAGQEHRFSDSVEVILIGRDKDCRVVYPPETTSVGKKHCKLRRLPDGIYAVEILGECPVDIDGVRVESGTLLKWESTLTLGGPAGPSFIVEITRNLSKRVDVEDEPQLGGASHFPGPIQASRAQEPLHRTKPLDLTTLWSERARAAVATIGLPSAVAASSIPLDRPMPAPPWADAPMTEARPTNSAPPWMEKRVNRVGPLIWLLGAAALALALYFLFRREAAHGAPLVKLIHGTMLSPPAPPARQSDLVDASVFGPSAVEPGEEALIQVFLHGLDQRDVARERAQGSDPGAARRGMQTLAAEIERGQRVDIVLEGRGLDVDQERQTLVWRGDPCACQFTIAASRDAAGRTFYPRVLVLVDSVPVGSVSFALKVIEQATAAADVELRGDRARRYGYAFLSYASPDRAEVIKRAQGLRAGGTSFFNDLLSLDPGERWEQRLYEEIDRCDVFYLFWSSQAKASKWVTKELDHALVRQARSSDGEPDIVPVIIEGPPPPAPPDQLKHLQFNDWMLYVLAGEERGASAAH